MFSKVKNKIAAALSTLAAEADRMRRSAGHGIVLAVMLALFGATTAEAEWRVYGTQVHNDDGWALTTTLSGNSRTITGVATAPGTATPLDLSVPIDDGTVFVSIGQNAFNNHGAKIKSVVLSSTLTSIGSNAFYGSTLTGFNWNGALKGGTIAAGTFYSVTFNCDLYIDGPATIADQAFFNTGTTKINGSLILGDSVTSIGQYAFRDNTGVKSVVLPSTLANMGAYVFLNCTFTNFVWNGAMKGKTIAVNTFYNVKFNCDLYIDGPAAIADQAFFNTGTTKITGSLILGDSVTSIGQYAFRDNTGMTRISSPSTGVSFGAYAFLNCSALQGVYFRGDYPRSTAAAIYYNNGSITSYVVTNQVPNWDLKVEGVYGGNWGIDTMQATWRDRPIRCGEWDVGPFTNYTYTVHYVDGQGNTSMRSETFYRGIGRHLSQSAYTWPGYVQTGWAAPGGAFYGNWAYVTDLAPAGGSVTLTAVWERYVPDNAVAVTFNFNDGGATPGFTTNMTFSTQYGAYFPAVPARAGHTFAGWARNGTAVAPTDTVPSGSTAHTLTAQWTAKSYPGGVAVDNGAITVPGPNGVIDGPQVPNNDDAVIHYPAGTNPETMIGGGGAVTLPSGGAVISTNGAPIVIDGITAPGTDKFPGGTVVLPNGTIIVDTAPAGTVKDPDGDGTYDVGPGDIIIIPPYDKPFVVPVPGGTYNPSIPGVFTGGGLTIHVPDGGTTDGSGNIVLPGPNGEFGDADDVTVIPGQGTTADRDGHGNVIIGSGETVTVEYPAGVSTNVTANGPAVILSPDGTVIIDTAPTGSVKDTDGDGLYDVGPGDIIIIPGEDPFTVPPGLGGEYNPHVPGIVVDEGTTVEVPSGKILGDSDPEKPRPNSNGSYTVAGLDGIFGTADDLTVSRGTGVNAPDIYETHIRVRSSNAVRGGAGGSEGGGIPILNESTGSTLSIGNGSLITHNGIIVPGGNWDTYDNGATFTLEGEGTRVYVYQPHARLLYTLKDGDIIEIDPGVPALSTVPPGITIMIPSGTTVDNGGTPNIPGDDAVYLPGEDGTAGTSDDICVYPAGDGDCDGNGNVIVGPGDTVTVEYPDGTEVEVTGPAVILSPDGTIIDGSNTDDDGDGLYDVKPGDTVTIPGEDPFIVPPGGEGEYDSRIPGIITDDGTIITVPGGTTIVPPGGSDDLTYNDGGDLIIPPGTSIVPPGVVIPDGEWTYDEDLPGFVSDDGRVIHPDGTLFDRDKGEVRLPGADGQYYTDDDIVIIPVANLTDVRDADTGIITIPDGVMVFDGKGVLLDPPAPAGTVILPPGTVIRPGDGKAPLVEDGKVTTYPGNTVTQVDGTVITVEHDGCPEGCQCGNTGTGGGTLVLDPVIDLGETGTTVGSFLPPPATDTPVTIVIRDGDGKFVEVPGTIGTDGQVRVNGTVDDSTLNGGPYTIEVKDGEGGSLGTKGDVEIIPADAAGGGLRIITIEVAGAVSPSKRYAVYGHPTDPSRAAGTRLLAKVQRGTGDIAGRLTFHVYVPADADRHFFHVREFAG